MTISVWRYSHLALAVSSFLFIALASLTGVVLAFDAVNQKVPSYRAADFNKITLAEAIPAISKVYPEITEVSVDNNQFVTVTGIDTSGGNASAYVDPRTGKILGTPHKKSEFIEWTTSLHRSLFLHETGRFFVGLTAFFLLLIAISGTVLIIQRQRGLKRFFKKIAKEHFAQYYHVVLGRLSLIVIIIIAISGTYLSLARFGLFPEKKITHQIDFDNIKTDGKSKPADFPAFKDIALADIQKIEFPFADDPEEYYLLKLKDREIAVNQFTGEKLSEEHYAMSALLTNLSLDLHTGRGSIIWAVILGAASINILFFIYSGFVITWRRTRGRIRNKYKAEDCRFIILVGSENGNTMRFASTVQQQLIKNGHRSYVSELNNFKLFPKAEHFIILTATYGLGDAPSNAKKFEALITKYPQQQHVRFSVVAFGSHAYPDFCRFGFDVHNLLSSQQWAEPLLEIHTVNDKSPDQFLQWFNTWAGYVELPVNNLPALLTKKPERLKAMRVISKTAISHTDGAFLIKLKPGALSRFTSGDLLAIYPANDHRERLYSIGKVGKELQLSVRMHNKGLGSGYLYNCEPGDVIRARITRNESFYFPDKATTIVMICNGTGIAPFLGMIHQNTKKVDCHLYCGFREHSSFDLYKEALKDNLETQQLNSMHIAYSREGEKQYVIDLLKRDAAFITATLAGAGVLMICGSLAMERNVIELLESVCFEKTGRGISFYQSRGQIKSDCY
jgi:sulfite reductase (NADPH) flavoprotein alpha-component